MTDEVLQLQLEGHCCVLYPKRQVREVIPEVVRWREHLADSDLVVDVGQHIEHLATVRHGGVLAYTVLDLVD